MVSGLSLALFGAAWAASGGWAVNETPASSEVELIDPEFSQALDALAWVDREGRLWLAHIDPETGMIDPPDGRGVLIDEDAMTTADIRFVYNGPEWVSTTRGEEIVYTKFLPGEPHTPANARLAAASRDVSGAWRVRFLGGDPRNSRYSPYASGDTTGPNPVITYIDDRQNHYWRDLNSAASETFIGQFDGNLSLRPSRGERSMPLAQKTADGQVQVFRLWLDTNEREQLTFDGGHSRAYGAVWMWAAPEFGGEMLLGVLARNNFEFRVYRKRPGPSQSWSVIYRVEAPDQGQFGSMEPFTYDGRSFAVMTWKARGADQGSAIFVTNIDRSAPVARRVTPDDTAHSRRDPEVHIGAAGPRIYFSRYASNSSSCTFCEPEGIWVADPGLAP